MVDPSFSAAVGCVMGAAAGDTAGAFLEFSRTVTPETVAQAMSIPGGGIWNIGPGQLTDDTELALCLADGLVGADPAAGFPADAVAARYSWWLMESTPFDVGGTCRAAMRAQDEGAGLGAAMQARAAAKSMDSQANGALMRSTPLAVWTHRLPPAAAAQHARGDAKLSHPSKVCQDCNAAYVVAAGALIRRPGDAQHAVQVVEEWAASEPSLDPTVRQWLMEDSLTGETQAKKLIGWAKHAFILAFYHLRQNSTWEAAMYDTILRGGDTDTNAAIVGGLIGALHGLESIPEDTRHKVLSWQYRPGLGHGIARPSALSGSRIPGLVEQLYAAATRDDDVQQRTMDHSGAGAGVCVVAEGASS